VKHQYFQLGKADRGTVTWYLRKVTGYFLTQAKRLIRQYIKTGVIIDSVHQGDQNKRKGVYQVNAVDEVTQFQIIVTLERISEGFMLPVLKQILTAYPFKIKGFHTGNGSEYINYTVAELLEKLRIEFTNHAPGTVTTMAW